MSDNAEGTELNAADVLMEALDEAEVPFRAVAVITLVIYASTGGDLTIARDTAISTRPILCSKRAMNAINNVTRAVHDCIDRELDAFGAHRKKKKKGDARSRNNRQRRA